MTLKEDASIASTANSSVHSSSAHNPTQTKKCCRFLLSVIPIILSLWKQQDENNRDQTVSPASQTMDVGGIEPMTVDGFAVAIGMPLVDSGGAMAQRGQGSTNNETIGKQSDTIESRQANDRTSNRNANTPGVEDGGVNMGSEPPADILPSGQTNKPTFRQKFGLDPPSVGTSYDTPTDTPSSGQENNHTEGGPVLEIEVSDPLGISGLHSLSPEEKPNLHQEEHREELSPEEKMNLLQEDLRDELSPEKQNRLQEVLLDALTALAAKDHTISELQAALEATKTKENQTKKTAPLKLQQSVSKPAAIPTQASSSTGAALSDGDLKPAAKLITANDRPTGHNSSTPLIPKTSALTARLARRLAMTDANAAGSAKVQSSKSHENFESYSGMVSKRLMPPKQHSPKSATEDSKNAASAEDDLMPATKPKTASDSQPPHNSPTKSTIMEQKEIQPSVQSKTTTPPFDFPLEAVPPIKFPDGGEASLKKSKKKKGSNKKKAPGKGK